MQRLTDMLAPNASPEEERAHWAGLDPDPWDTSQQDSDLRSDGSSSPRDSRSLSTFRSEGEHDASEPREPTPQPSTGEPQTSELGGAHDIDQRAAEVAAFQVAVSEARQEAEAQLQAIVERVRKDAEEQHAAEIDRVTERHADELEQTRAKVEAEVTERVQQEESRRHAAELTRVLEVLEARYAADLQSARSAAVESFKELTGSIQLAEQKRRAPDTAA